MKYLPAIIVIALGLVCLWQGYDAGAAVVGMGLIGLALRLWAAGGLAIEITEDE